MEHLSDLSNNLDPFVKLLALLGGSGGVMYWIDRFRNRTSLRVRILGERFGGFPADLHLLTLEVVNIGRDPTSLEPTMSGYTPKREKRRSELTIQAKDRFLPPHATRVVEAIGPNEVVFRFLWFKKFRVVPTRGKAFEVRVRSADNLSISRF